MNVDAADLLMRLYSRYSPVFSAAQRSDIDESMREEALLALQTLLRIGIGRGRSTAGQCDGWA